MCERVGGSFSSSQEELSVDGLRMESQWSIFRHHRCHQVNAEPLTGNFMEEKGYGLGLNGASTMSGSKSGVQTRIRRHAPSALYVHCHCHRLQLAAVHAAKEHPEVKKNLGTLLTIWKTFHYSPEKLKFATSGGLELEAQWAGRQSEGLVTAFALHYSWVYRRKGSVHRIDVGVAGQSYSVSSALYRSVRLAEETSDVAFYRTTRVCSRSLSSVRP